MSENTNTREALGDGATLDGLVGHTLESFTDNAITSLRQYAFYRNNTLAEISLPVLTSGGNYVFAYCSALESVNLPGLTYIQQYAFRGCIRLEDIDLTNITTLNNSAFYGCTGLQEIRLPNVSSIPASCFSGCTGLKKIYVGANSGTVVPLSNTSAFTNTGRGLFIVPNSLVSNYRSASNWTTYASRIFGDTDTNLPVWEEEEITDSWETIAANIQNGTATSLYKMGNYKAIDLGTEGTIEFQIVAVNADELASGNGTATFSWIARKLLNSLHAMNGSSTTVGGWAASDMRLYLTDTIWPLIPAAVQSMIKEVKKYSDGYSSSIVHDEMTTDKIWIPSARETFAGISYEQTGPMYTFAFAQDADRVRYRNTSSTNWWLRSAGSGTYFRYVLSYGNVSTHNASNSYGVCLGFCT